MQDCTPIDTPMVKGDTNEPKIYDTATKDTSVPGNNAKNLMNQNS